ncbi:hypothetical protein FHS18_006533 [Paenibacillus phyllosphaerae]|uniref:Uncharacterized protein n=1 Tax=Paenibacillus phyllosphaerae TaxID=274593 RepID=A0A7W5B4T2_9BACL|nr:hypothetical protein [Paenibacillus phyllosphaerae]MBB3114412.1 hypothetical protein [Paenibacillus phyllosphaerae]
MALHHEPLPARSRFDRMLSTDYPLCREDVIWMLEYMKKKMADEAPLLASLPQPQLLQSFQSFAEAATILIKQRSGCGPEADRLRSCLLAAADGLLPRTDKP